MNTLYFGDNLKILRDYIGDESVDLTVEGPLNGKQVQLPPSLDTFKQAGRVEVDTADQSTLQFD